MFHNLLCAMEYIFERYRFIEKAKPVPIGGLAALLNATV